MNIIIILVHGFNVANPEFTINKFRQYFESLGCMVEAFTYGYVPFTWQITRSNPKIAKRLAGRCEYWADQGYKVIITNHSNGATITRIATEIHGAPIWRVLSIHPALTKTLHPCETADKVIVVHNEGDSAVVAGKWLSAIVRRLTPNRYRARPWGEMGKVGYKGDAPNVQNIDTGDATIFEPTAHGHSDEFSKSKANYFLHQLAALILGQPITTNKGVQL